MKINIGTSKGNLTNILINKKFKNIQFKDVLDIVKSKLGTVNKIQIIGWYKSNGKEKKI